MYTEEKNPRNQWLWLCSRTEQSIIMLQTGTNIGENIKLKFPPWSFVWWRHSAKIKNSVQFLVAVQVWASLCNKVGSAPKWLPAAAWLLQVVSTRIQQGWGNLQETAWSFQGETSHCLAKEATGGVLDKTGWQCQGLHTVCHWMLWNSVLFYKKCIF